MTCRTHAIALGVSSLLLVSLVLKVRAEQPPVHVGRAAATTPAPRIAMLWAPLRGDESLASHSRHDMIMIGLDRLGLQRDASPPGLADGFTEESIAIATARLLELRQLNPRAVILADLVFYEYPDDWLPEDHPWWLRRDGERVQFWPGTHRMDWNRDDYRRHVVRQTVALERIGVDGVFYDNLRNEPEPWIALLTSVRQAVGKDFLILANAGYAVGEYDFAAPLLNGMMYESGWSHERGEWDELIKQMQHTESLLRAPRISLIERFEEIRDQAGWPGDPQRGQKPPADPAARRWSLCFSLIVGDFYYLFSDNTSHRHDWYPEYDVKIGQPSAAGRRLNAHAWTRRYEGGEVFVNLPGAAQPLTVTVPFQARDSLSGETGSQFTIEPGDGRVLLPLR
jgi:hypothetical protein